MEKNNIYDDLLEIEEHVFTLNEIDTIARDIQMYERYKVKFHDEFHSKLLLSITHTSYEEKEAKYYWGKIVNHMIQLEKKLERRVGIVVSTLDYLCNVEAVVSNPRIIDKNKSRFIVKTSLNDELTNLYLRDVFDIVIKKEFSKSQRTDTSLALLMIDIDDFKSINDTYGHLTGDDVLSKLGETINSHVREMDFAARYGGEEIAILMPDTELKRATMIADRLRRVVEAIDFGNFGITISIGVANQEVAKDEVNLIEHADIALYEAKETGKNKVVQYNEIE